MSAVEAQRFERAWWGDCANTFHEEQKQLVYARHMGLYALEVSDAGHPPSFDLTGMRVADIGGGPASLLLKCEGFGYDTVVVDPCEYPAWVAARYLAHGLVYDQRPGETWDSDVLFDEVWVYNVLQHVEDPERLIRNARTKSNRFRLFDWINVAAHEGHPHELKAHELERWLGVTGRVREINQDGAEGEAFVYAGFVP